MSLIERWPSSVYRAAFYATGVVWLFHDAFTTDTLWLELWDIALAGAVLAWAMQATRDWCVAPSRYPARRTHDSG